ncbi:hypothetical protein AGMMS4957_16030 [Bacteroidia bacterium]|nr:hypothetical protein AGMMS4957_16030 [Bacteroidia bacterium]
MRNKFEIGDDGSIFSIGDDGTIHRIGKIDSQGRIDGQKPKGKSGWAWFFAILFVVSAFIAKTFYFDIINQINTISQLKSENITLQQQNREENQNLTSKITELTTENKKLQDKINSVSNWPLIIKTLQVGNAYYDGSMETDFGETLFSFSSMYLVPQIEYISLRPKQTITVYQKLYKNDVLTTGTSSPQGYSAKYDLYLSKEGKTRLMGWGNNTMGNWPAGNYRYEIWYNNMCLKALNFILY